MLHLWTVAVGTRTNRTIYSTIENIALTDVFHIVHIVSCVYVWINCNSLHFIATLMHIYQFGHDKVSPKAQVDPKRKFQ